MEWREYAHPYLNMVPSHAVGAAMRSNLEALGRTIVQRAAEDGSGSTDFGNVSHRVPAAYAYLGICGREAGWHTREVAEATRTGRGQAAILAGAKLLAMTAIDILADEALRAQAHAEHQVSLRPIREALARLES
jgi:metal-dependent amidase/aminoacylase/carboxypeptidase family protein